MSRLSGEEVKPRVERRMAQIDALPQPVRAVVHDYGWRLVKTMIECGVTDAKKMRRIINDVVIEVSPFGG